MSAKFLFVNTGTEAVTLRETFPEGHFNAYVVEPGDHRVVVLWAGKHISVVAPPERPSQGQMYRGRSQS